MLERLKTVSAALLRPPQIEDLSNGGRATMVYRIAGLGLLLILVCTPLAVSATSNPTISLVGISALALLFLSLVVLVRQQHVSLAIGLLLILTWVAITGVIVVWGGLDSPVVAAYLTHLVLVGVLAGRRATILTGIVTIVTLVAIGVLDSTDRLPTLFEPSVSHMLTVGVVLIFLMTIFVAATVNVLNVVQRRALNSQVTLEHTMADLRSTILSRDYVDNILQSINNLLFVLDDKANIRMANPAALKLLGYTEGELIGQPFSLIYPRKPVDNETQRNDVDILATQRLGDNGLTHESEFRTKGGQPVPVSFTISSMRSESGNVTGLVCVAQDITPQRAIESERLRQAMRYRALFEQSNDAIFIAGLDGATIAANQRASEIFGYSTSEFTKIRYRELVVQREADESDTTIQKLMRGERVQVYERTFRRKDGSEFPAEVNVQLVYDVDGNPLHVQSLIRDITERRKAQEETQYHSTLLQNVSDAVISTDTSDRIMSWNKAAETVYGWTADEVIGKPLSDIVPTEYPNGSRDFIQKQYLVRGRWRSEVRQKRRDGEELTISSSVSVLHDSKGAITGIVSVNHDITQRKKAEDELEERVVQLAALRQVDVEINTSLDVDQVLRVALHAAYLLSGADAGFIMLNEDGHFRTAQTIGKYNELKTGEISESYGTVAQAVQTREPMLVSDVTQAQSYVIDIESTRAQIVIPLIYQDRLIGVLNLETDDESEFTVEKFEFIKLLTQRIAVALDNARLYQLSRQQVDELQRLYDRVKNLEQLKSDMIRIASHDLRNPIGVVRGYLELMRMDFYDRINEAEKSYVEEVERQVEKMNRIVTDILSLERIEQSASKHEPFDLVSVSRGALMDNEQRAVRKNQTLNRSLTDEGLIGIGDAPQIKEAMDNLISNAIKYTPDGGTIEVTLKRDGDQAVFIVKDTGYGIPKEEQSKLFKPFSRIRTDDTSGIEGTGLGLYLVKNIIERHGGEMIFHSVEGSGSIFGFKLPLPPDDALARYNSAPDAPDTPDAPDARLIS